MPSEIKAFTSSFKRVQREVGCLFLIISGLFYNHAYAEGDPVRKVNNYVDEVLDKLVKEGKKSESLDIPDVCKKNFRLSYGKLSGFRNLYRHGDCKLEIEDNISTATVEVDVKDVAVEVTYETKFFAWLKGNATVTVDDVTAKMDISSKDGKALLESFEVIRFGNYKIKEIVGPGSILNKILNSIINNVAKNFSSKIKNALENEVAKEIGDLVKKHEFPVLRN